MRVEIIHMGTIRADCVGLSGVNRYIHEYKLQAVNGLIAHEYSDDWIEPGYYELPDKDWDPNNLETEDIDDDEETDLFCSPAA